VLALEDRHDRADELEGDLGILGPAVPDPPVQDFRDDHGPGGLPLRGVGRQGAGRRFGMSRYHPSGSMPSKRQRAALIDIIAVYSKRSLGEQADLPATSLTNAKRRCRPGRVMFFTDR
jgi:hypothetical protein